MDKKLIKTYLLWGLYTGIFTIVAASRLSYEMDNRLPDVLYQERWGIGGRIAIVDIDQRSLEALGPFGIQDRRILAQMVSYLDQGDIRPAVIGLDVLPVGETGTEEDLLSAEAAGTGENVITAAAGTSGSFLVIATDGTFYLDDFIVKSFDEPYKVLRDVTAQGHISAMYNKDGILRHQLLELGLPNGRVSPPFVLTIARKYMQQGGGQEAGPPPVDSKGFWYLNYPGLPEDYSEFISIMNLLEGNIPSECFADRVVFIGSYAIGLGDQYITSTDRGDPMYGMEIQVNAIRTLPEGDYREEPSTGIQLAVPFLVLAAVGAWFKNSRLAGGEAVQLVGSFAYVVIARATYEEGAVLRTLWIPLGLTPFFGAPVMAHHGKVVPEKQRVTVIFKCYATPEIVDEVLRQETQSLELGGKLIQLAMLSVDIRGFTSMPEALESGQMVEVLNSYLTLVSSFIKNHGGTLGRSIGDAAMVFWGAPLAQEDYVMKAVLAVLDMTEGTDRLENQPEACFGRRFTFGTGIHINPAMVGNVGTPDRMDYTAIRDMVNAASRLESNAPGGRIYISVAVTNALGGKISTKVIGSIRLKGRAGELRVLELEGSTEGSSDRMPVLGGEKAD